MNAVLDFCKYEVISATELGPHHPTEHYVVVLEVKGHFVPPAKGSTRIISEHKLFHGSKTTTMFMSYAAFTEFFASRKRSLP